MMILILRRSKSSKSFFSHFKVNGIRVHTNILVMKQVAVTLDKLQEEMIVLIPTLLVT